jgi:hypothetical protein
MMSYHTASAKSCRPPEQTIFVFRFSGYHPKNDPMFNYLFVFVESKNINAGVIVSPRPFLMTREHDEILLCDGP